jgi:hypothetical protein
MLKRSLIEKYSAFGQVKQDSNGLPIITEWEQLPRLRRSMERMTESQPGVGQDYWDLFLLKKALEQPTNQSTNRPTEILSSAHIMARLEESCLFVVRKICQDFVYLKISPEECFYLARAEAANPRKLFKSFDFHRGCKITTYVKRPLRNFLLEKVRIGHSLIKYRPPGLLKNISLTHLKDIFKTTGVKNGFTYILARECFVEICCSDGVQQIPWPLDNRQLETIAQRYQSRLEAIAKSDNSPGKEYLPLTGKQIQEVLTELNQLIRDSFKIRHISRDNHSRDNNSECYSQLNYEQILPDDDNYDEEKQIIQRERQAVESILSDAFSKLSQPIQNMMILVHGLGFGQGEIPTVLGFRNQSEVSKELKKQRQQLLKTLVTALPQQLEIDEPIQLTSEQVSQGQKEIKEWLKKYSQKLYSSILADRPLNFIKNARQQKHNQVKSFLVKCLRSEIEINMDISLLDVTLTKPSIKKGLTVNELIEQRLTDFVETCLSENPTFFFNKQEETYNAHF